MSRKNTAFSLDKRIRHAIMRSTHLTTASALDAKERGYFSFGFRKGWQAALRHMRKAKP